MDISSGNLKLAGESEKHYLCRTSRFLPLEKSGLKSKCLLHFYIIFGRWLEGRMLDMCPLLSLQLVLEVTSLCSPSVQGGCPGNRVRMTQLCTPHRRERELTADPVRREGCPSHVVPSEASCVKERHWQITVGDRSVPTRAAHYGQGTGSVPVTRWGQ